MTDPEIIAAAEEAIRCTRPWWANRCRWISLDSERQARDMDCKQYGKKFLLDEHNPLHSTVLAAGLYWRTILALAHQQGLCHALAIGSDDVLIREDTVVWHTPMEWEIERNLLNPDIWVTMNCWIRVGRAA